jgi:hypothetical protein
MSILWFRECNSFPKKYIKRQKVKKRQFHNLVAHQWDMKEMTSACHLAAQMIIREASKEVEWLLKWKWNCAARKSQLFNLMDKYVSKIWLYLRQYPIETRKYPRRITSIYCISIIVFIELDHLCVSMHENTKIAKFTQVNSLN